MRFNKTIVCNPLAPSPSLIAEFYRRGTLVLTAPFEGPLLIGRQRLGEPEPYTLVETPDGARVVVEHATCAHVSREHLRLRPVAHNTLNVSNVSKKAPLSIEPCRSDQGPNSNAKTISGRPIDIPPQGTRGVSLPVRIVVGETEVLVRPSSNEPEEYISAEAPPVSLTDSLLLDELVTLGGVQPTAAGEERGLDWLRRVLEIVQRSASADDFLSSAARAVLDTTPLDTAGVLLRGERGWSTAEVASTDRGRADDWRPSQTMLARVLETKRTVRHLPDAREESFESLHDVRALVAAPILSRDGEVMGVVYGDRRSYTASADVPTVSESDVKMIELLASALAAGLSRLEQERAALATRVRFEQFFTPELSRQLHADANLLKGRDSEVSLLFGDIGGFSRISERMGPEATVEWINHSFELLSECVADEAGVLVDYVGDELFAMWGAPEPAVDQASRACRAALCMQQRLGEIDKVWQARTGEPFRFSIGINTGVARVGNVGSERKFKYGPLGSPVNVASRCQGATKHLRADIVVTGQTAAKLDTSEFALRRLCKIRVVNIEEPIDAYELAPAITPEWSALKSDYEQALRSFEACDYLTAAKVLGSLLTRHPDDGPAILLLARTVERLANPTDSPMSAVWELGSK